MRIGGQEFRRIGEGWVKIPQPDGPPVPVKIRAFPLGFDVDAKFPLPEPPRIRARRANGTVERDAQGRVLWETNERDPQYRALRERMERVRKAAQVAQAVVPGDGPGELRLQTDCTRDDEDGYLALWEELKQAGLTDGDLVLIVYRAKELSNMTDKAMETALADFSPAAGSPPDSGETEA